MGLANVRGIKFHRFGQARDVDLQLNVRNGVIVLKKVKFRYRSAITGRYVSPEFAKRNPSTTVREKVVHGSLTA